MKKILLQLILLLVFIQLGYSQFSFFPIPYSPYPFTGGTKLPVDTNYSLWDDKFSAAIPIGFTFTHIFSNFDYLKIGTNGIISFDTTSANTATCPYSIGSMNCGTLPNPTFNKSCVMPYLVDLSIRDTSRSNINYYTTGVAPDRKMVINYYDIPLFSNSIARGCMAQCVLYETSNKIEIFIQHTADGSPTYGATIGGQDSSGTIGYRIRCGYWNDTSIGYRILPPPPAPTIIDTGVITGKTYYDVNGNCIFDSLIDIKAPLQVVRANNGINISMSDLEGNYTMYIDSGYHTITTDSNWYFQSNCPLSHSINFLAYPDTFSGINFADSTLPCTSPNINIISTGLVPCDTASTIYVSIQNMYPILQYNLQLIVELNDSLHINQCSVPYTSLGSNRYLLDIADTMLPYTFDQIYFLCNVGCDSLGSIYSYNAILSGDNNCATNFQDSSYNTSMLVASYDPNDMLVKVANTNQPFNIENLIDSNSVLEYMITFQNNGTANARNIRVENILNTDHIANTIEITGSSYPCFYTLTGNKLNFAFQNINLPFGDISDPTTHGFVTFKIKQTPGHIPSYSIYNDASIYFDYNSPIYTNTSIAYIPYSCDKNLNITANSPLCTNEHNGSIIVNPDPGYGIYTYYWYNDSTNNSISNLSSGTYYLDVYDALCYYTDTIELVNPNPVVINLTASTDSVCLGDTVFLQASGANSYLWSIGTSNNSIIYDIPMTDKMYSVIGYDLNMCASSIQDITIYIKNCDAPNVIGNVDQYEVKIFPTLTNDKIYLELNQEIYNKISITNLDGRVYYESTKIFPEIQVGDFPKGIYVIHLQSDSKDYYQKISVY